MKRINKRFITKCIIIVLSLTFMLTGCGKEPENVIAKVDRDSITKEEFDKEFNIAYNLLLHDPYNPNFTPDIMKKDAGNDKTFEDILKENVLNQLILDNIALNEAESKDITVSDKEVKEQINSIEGNYFGGEDKYREFLEDLKKSGVSEDAFRDSIKKQIIIQKYRNDYIEKLDISEDEAKKYFEENKDNYIQIRARHILVQSEEEAKKILKRIKDGEDFAKIAKEKSIDTVSAENGGDLGYFPKGQMVKEFEGVAFSLKKGEISDIVKTDFGYHIIKVEDRLDRYEDAKESVVSDLQNQKFNENLNKLMDKANVKIYIDFNEEKNKKDEDDKNK